MSVCMSLMTESPVCSATNWTNASISLRLFKSSREKRLKKTIKKDPWTLWASITRLVAVAWQPTGCTTTVSPNWHWRHSADCVCGHEWWSPVQRESASSVAASHGRLPSESSFISRDTFSLKMYHRLRHIQPVCLLPILISWDTLMEPIRQQISVRKPLI